jgi:hypothetical protein
MLSSKWLGIAALVFSISAGGCGSHSTAKKPDSSTDAPAESKDTGDAPAVDVPAEASLPDATDTNVADAIDAADAGAPDATDASDAMDAPATADASDAKDAVDAAVATDATDAAEVGVSCGDAGDGGCSLPLFNTGVDNNGVVLAGGSVDPHYKLIQSADTTFTGPDAIVTSQIAEGYWVAQSATSKWIAASANQSYPGATPCDATGVYVYRTTFNLTGYDLATVKLKGAWGADNMGTAIRLNGVTTGLTAGGYAPLTDFKIETGFVAGLNTLDFEDTDLGCPNGLRVELSGTAALKP